MKKIFSINVPGRHGYSFAVKCDASYDENSIIKLAEDALLFNSEDDVCYAFAEDITDSEYDIKAFALADCTYEL